MGTVIRAEISKKGKWWISKHRYYELKHFCLQYNEFKEELESLIRLPGSFCDISGGQSYDGDRTANSAIRRTYFTNRIEMIEQAAMESDPDIYTWLLKGVTEGYTYEYLHTMMGMPCSRVYYYDRYRKFFWCLSRKSFNL